jgi:hypothetical protein
MTDKKHLEEQLAAVPIFAGLSRRQVGKLVDASKETRHQAGHELAKEGEGALALHLITSGTASVSVHGESVRTQREGDYFGEISRNGDGTVSLFTTMIDADSPLRPAYDRLDSADLASLYRELAFNAPGSRATLSGEPGDRNVELLLKKR